MAAEEGALPRVVITGPTGWIGSAMLAHLAARLGPGWRDRVALFASSARPHRSPGGDHLDMRPLDTIAPDDVEGAIVLHLAYLTKEKADLLGERRFTDTNLAIDDQLLAALAEGRPQGVFIASSGAAALAADGRDRHPYGLCKLRQEDRFLGWGAKAGVPVLAGRIFNLAGPYINKIESYAISNFLAQARRERRMTIQAQVPVFRSYLHVDDLCGLVITALEQGIGQAAAFDLCGAEVLEMADIAERISTYLGGVPVLRGDVDLARPSAYLGNFVETRSLGMRVGRSLASFEQQLVATDEWLVNDVNRAAMVEAC
jgi:nucleoside-diphosphate-sugar epimerase